MKSYLNSLILLQLTLKTLLLLASSFLLKGSSWCGIILSFISFISLDYCILFLFKVLELFLLVVSRHNMKLWIRVVVLLLFLRRILISCLFALFHSVVFTRSTHLRTLNQLWMVNEFQFFHFQLQNLFWWMADDFNSCYQWNLPSKTVGEFHSIHLLFVIFLKFLQSFCWG